MNAVTYLFFLYITLFEGALNALPIDDSTENVVTPGKVGTNCACGWTNQPRGRIIGGVDAGEHEWPMMVALIAKTGSYKKNALVCGGTLITRRHIVTAGHCVHTKGGVPLKPEQLSVVLGAHKLSRIDYEDPEIMRKPEKFISHPQYEPPVTYDVAIIILEKRVEYSKIIGPACLPTERMYPVGKKLKAIGWGFSDYKATQPDVLQKTKLNVVTPNHCFKYKEFDKVVGNQYCTHQGGNTGQCVGDSGGPILWRDPDTNMYTLLAAPSFSSAGCVWEPAVVSDITYYLPWIQQVISETYPEEQTCSKVKQTKKEDIFFFPE